MLLEPTVKAIHNTLLATILLSIFFNAGFINSSAIQRYLKLHRGMFVKTTGLNDKIPRATNVQRGIIDGSDAFTEKNINISNHNDVIKEGPRDRTMTSPSSLWRFIRFASETYFTEISSTKQVDDYTTSASTSGTTTSTSSTTTSTTPPKIIVRTTTMATPSSTSKLALPSSTMGCTATCGSCTGITAVNGVIMSPNYPDHYYLPSDIGYMYCQYTINVPVGKRIHLVFQELNLAFTDWDDFLEVVDNSPENYGKVLATFNAGDEAVNTTTKGESMFIFFEANRGGYTKNGKAPAWKATYYVVEK